MVACTAFELSIDAATMQLFELLTFCSIVKVIFAAYRRSLFNSNGSFQGFDSDFLNAGTRFHSLSMSEQGTGHSITLQDGRD